MNSFKILGLRGKIEMKSPQQTYWIIPDHGDLRRPDEAPLQIFFAREVPPLLGLPRPPPPQVAEGARSLVDVYTLKKRQYLGTTSMDAELSLISANMAHVRPDSTPFTSPHLYLSSPQIRPGSVFFDPFAGTGSFLVAGAAFGARVLGGDIDITVLRGSTNPF